MTMRKRQRKKLKLGEFGELGFSISFKEAPTGGKELPSVKLFMEKVESIGAYCWGCIDDQEGFSHYVVEQGPAFNAERCEEIKQIIVDFTQELALNGSVEVGDSGDLYHEILPDFQNAYF